MIGLRRLRSKSVPFLGTAVVLFAAGWSGPSALRYVNSDQFCGNVCHRAMASHFVSHASSAHANVSCVTCHGGAGALGKVSAKLSGVRHAWANLVGYEHPITVSAQQSAQISESCIECHPLANLPASKERIRPYQAVNVRLPSRTIGIHLRLKPTSQQTHTQPTERVGIGWHMDPANRVSFVEDAQGRVLWIESESPKNGKQTYVSMDTSRSASEFEAMPRRGLGCTGCHNRLAHDFSSSATLAVPAMAQTPKTNLGFDSSQYRNQLGHLTDLGCFRCHDGRHRSTRGTILSSDCATVCHNEPRIIAESPPVTPLWPSPTRWHVGDLPNLTPEVIAHSRLLCNDCHSQSHTPKHACEDCHHAPGLDRDSGIARRPDG